MDERVVATSHASAAALDPADLTDEPAQARWGLVALAIFAAGIAGFILLQTIAPDPGQIPRQVSAPLVQTVPVSLVLAPIQVRGSGPVRPRADVELTAQVSGEVVEISPNLVTGGRFKQGETLARIDPRPYRAALDQAEADRLARTADLAFAERQLERDQQLAQSGAASERRRDETLNQRDRAQAQIAGLDALIAARAIDLERTAITAPFDGQVLTETIDLGSVVRPGTALGRIYATDLFEIVVPLSDREAALIPGLWETTLGTKPKATATLPFRGQVYAWDGYVDRVEAGIDPETRTIDVVVRIPNPLQRGRIENSGDVDGIADPPPMLVGTYAGVEIEGVVLTHASIPRPALRNDNTIWLADNTDTLRVMPVDLVQDQGDVVVIRSSAIADGDRLIVSDLPIASDGLTVRTTDARDIEP